MSSSDCTKRRQRQHLSVCLSATIYLGNHSLDCGFCPNLTKFSAHVTYGRGAALLSSGVVKKRYVLPAAFVDDVISARNRRRENGVNSKRLTRQRHRPGAKSGVHNFHVGTAVQLARLKLAATETKAQDAEVTGKRRYRGIRLVNCDGCDAAWVQFCRHPDRRSTPAPVRGGSVVVVIITAAALPAFHVTTVSN